MGRLVTLATCNLNQWALDYAGNLERVKESIRIAKSKGAAYRVGPELEISGYGCLDHFLELDLYDHAMDQLLDILSDRSLDDIVIDLGLLIMHRSNRYNARCILLNGRILLFRPKLYLANDGNYREARHFIPWKGPRHMEEFKLPARLASFQGSRTVPIGDAILDFNDTSLGVETCEELFMPNAPHIDMSLNGAEIFSNASGSHHTLRKLDRRLQLILEATKKCAGVYIYANQQGCDGDRLYYDGSSSIIMNGNVYAMGSQFSLNDVEVSTAVVDLDDVLSHRFAPSRGQQVNKCPEYPRIRVEHDLLHSKADMLVPSPVLTPRLLSPEEEISTGPAAWLWDYLRRSKQAGFLIPLSGGIDSCSTATLVFSMCTMVVDALKTGNEQVKSDVQRIASYGDKGWLPATAQELCNRILHTVYLGMKSQSSKDTRSRAQRFSEAINSYHLDVDIDDVYEAQRNLLTSATGYEPKFKVFGGTDASNLALQNIQARSRMVSAYYFAQLICTVRQRPTGGSLLVLGSGNVDECLRGYLTKYDCSSADVNPIGSISKTDLKKFIKWSITAFDLPILEEFLNATPTAELEPLTDDYSQSDEVDMGMSYAELSVFGRLRKEQRLGPYAMFERLLHEWRDQHSPREIADKVKRFHHYYAINRHKMTTMTPAYHAEEYSPDDNRYDLRPFLYPAFYSSFSFKKIDEKVELVEKRAEEGK